MKGAGGLRYTIITPKKLKGSVMFLFQKVWPIAKRLFASLARGKASFVILNTLEILKNYLANAALGNNDFSI